MLKCPLHVCLEACKMEDLSVGGPGWQVLGVSGRQTGGRFSTLAGQKVDEWGWAHGHFDFPHSTLLWHQRTRSLGCQHEFNLVEMDGVFRLLNVVYDGF